MLRSFLAALLGAGIFLFFTSGTVIAAGPSKGLKIDPLLEQAIRKTAQPEIEEVKEVEELSAKKPVFEEELIWKEPKAEPLPVIEEITIKEEPQKPKGPRSIGSKYNGMLFLPSFIAKEGWNDNVFATDGSGKSDLVTYLTPSLRIEIPDIRHEISFEGSYELRKHLDNSDEDQHNTKTKFGGHLEAERGFTVPFGFAWESTNEEREDDLTQQRSDNPLKSDDFKAEGGIQFKPGSFGLALIGRYHKQRYEDDTSTINAAQVIRRDADRDITGFEFNTSFDLDTENTLMLWGGTGQRDYERQNFQGGGFTGPRRDSKTFSGMMSWLFNYEGLAGHMSFGVHDYNYESPAIQDVKEFVGDIEIEHKLSDLTSLNFQLARTIDEDEEVIDPIIHSRVGLYFDHRPWEEILVAVGADYDFLEFNNSGRDDETWKFRVVADYFMSNIWAFGGEYVYTIRDSELNGLDFDRSIFLLRARGRL